MLSSVKTFGQTVKEVERSRRIELHRGKLGTKLVRPER